MHNKADNYNVDDKVDENSDDNADNDNADNGDDNDVDMLRQLTYEGLSADLSSTHGDFGALLRGVFLGEEHKGGLVFALGRTHDQTLCDDPPWMVWWVVFSGGEEGEVVLWWMVWCVVMLG